MSAPVGFDNTFLSLLLNPNCRLPADRNGQIVPNALRRAQYLVDCLGKSRQKIILPTPAAAELLTAIGPTAQIYYDIVAKSRLFEVASFDQKCAVELAILNTTVFSASDKRDTLEPYQKIKVDRQILAILKTYGSETIYTDDNSLANRASLCGITAVSTAELLEPEQDRQLEIEFDANEMTPEIAGNVEEIEFSERQRERPTAQHAGPA